jgi:hypothetical protein
MIPHVRDSVNGECRMQNAECTGQVAEERKRI